MEYRKVGIRMIRNFKYKNGKIKLMWNERLMLKNYECDWHRKQIKTNTFQISSSFLLGVELMVHRGGRICYGMLTAQVQPNNEQDCVKISIGYTHKNTIKFIDSFLTCDDNVYKGLPEEYAEQVLSSIVSTISEKDRYPQCNLIFEDSANCEVGSSPMLFGLIAEIITNIIYTSSPSKILDMDIELFTNQYVKNIGLRY